MLVFILLLSAVYHRFSHSALCLSKTLPLNLILFFPPNSLHPFFFLYFFFQLFCIYFHMLPFLSRSFLFPSSIFCYILCYIFHSLITRSDFRWHAYILVIVLALCFLSLCQGKLSKVPHDSDTACIIINFLEEVFFQDRCHSATEEVHSEIPEDCPLFQSELCCPLSLELCWSSVASMIINMQNT